MKHVLAFMPNYLSTACFFVHVETFYRLERINDFLTVSMCSSLCVSFDVGTFREHIGFWPNSNISRFSNK